MISLLILGLLVFNVSAPIETAKVAVGLRLYPFIYSWTFWILSITLGAIFGYIGLNVGELIGGLAGIIAAVIVAAIITSIF